jgi:hypothetical protein
VKLEGIVAKWARGSRRQDTSVEACGEDKKGWRTLGKEVGEDMVLYRAIAIPGTHDRGAYSTRRAICLR